MATLDAGTVVAEGDCPECGGPADWKVTSNGQRIMFACKNLFRDPKRRGTRCGRQVQPSTPGCQAVLEAFIANGRRPLQVGTTDPTMSPPKPARKAAAKPKEIEHDDEPESDDEGDGGGGILGRLFGD